MLQKSEVFNVTQTNFLILQKVLRILMSQKLSFIMSQRLTEAATEGALQKKVFLEISQNSQEKHLCQRLFFNKVAGQVCNFIKKESLAQVFSCEFCKISKNTFYTEHFRTTAPGLNFLMLQKRRI